MEVKNWLRRLAIRYLSLVPKCDYDAARTHIRVMDNEFAKLRLDYRWANHRIDELNQILDGYRKDAWRPALEKALEDQKRKSA